MERSVWLRPVGHEKAQREKQKRSNITSYVDHQRTKGLQSEYRYKTPSDTHVFCSQDQMITELPSHLHTLTESCCEAEPREHKSEECACLTVIDKVAVAFRG